MSEKLPDDVERAICEYAISSMDVERGTHKCEVYALESENALRAAILKYGDERAADERRRAIEEAARMADEFAPMNAMRQQQFMLHREGAAAQVAGQQLPQRTLGSMIRSLLPPAEAGK